MGEVLLPAFAASAAAIVVALALLVPFVAVQFRRRGAVRARPVLLGSAALVYVLGLAAYTLLPLPTVVEGFCAEGGAGVQLQPGRFLGDVVREGVAGPAALLGNPAVLQVALNLVLFVPLGVLVRGVVRRGVVVATAIGLLVSLVIEVTQLTGLWFLYPCSYRLFDVDDLLVNTAGALIGALVAPALHLGAGRRPPDPDRPRPVTAGRRLLGMVCDVLTSAGIGMALGLTYVLGVIGTGAVVPPDVDAQVRALLTGVVPALVLLAWTVRSGRTVGEAAVRLRPRRPGSTPAVVLRWLVGIGGYLLLSALMPAPLGPASALLAVVSIVAVFRTRGHRGLAYRAVGWDVEDDRERADVLPDGTRS